MICSRTTALPPPALPPCPLPLTTHSMTVASLDGRIGFSQAGVLPPAVALAGIMTVKDQCWLMRPEEHPSDGVCAGTLIDSGHTASVPLHFTFTQGWVMAPRAPPHPSYLSGLGDGSSEADWRLLNAGWAYADAVLISGIVLRL